MKNPLKHFTIAITGDFGQHRTLDKMRQWIQANGGTFANEINPKVTHLISSKEHFKKNRGLVKAAREFEKIKIVSFDWLEDTLIRMRPHKEREYLMSLNGRAHKEDNKKKKTVRDENIKRGLEAFEKTCKEFENEMNSCNYHIYHDETAYRYDITLARADLLTNRNERYMLKLYETHGSPKLYACFERYSAPGAASTASVLAPVGSSFDVAFDHFKKFFRLKTGKEWDDRLRKTSSSKDCFVFVPPKDGQPRGIVLSDGIVEAAMGGNTLPLENGMSNGETSNNELALQSKDE